MEEGQRPLEIGDVFTIPEGLNPCCNGRGSKTMEIITRDLRLLQS